MRDDFQNNQSDLTSEIPLRYKNAVPLSPGVGGLGRRLGSVMPWKLFRGVILNSVHCITV